MMKKTKKKIAFISDSMDTGGTEKAILELANHLSPDKYDITVIQFYPGGKYQNELNKNIKRRVMSIFSERQTRLNVYMFKIVYKMSNILRHLLYIGKHYDIEIACGYGFPTKAVSVNSKSKKICWVHMDVSMDRHVVSEMTKEEGKKYFDKIDEFVCVSNDCAKKFNEKFGYEDKTSICYNVVPADKIIKMADYHIELDKDCFNIVSVGRLTWQKGFDILLEAVKKLIKGEKKFKLHIIGQGEDFEKLKKFVAENKLEAYVKFWGYVDNPYPFIKNADLYVCSSRHESFSLTVAESLILETPVMSTKCTGPIELLDNGKYGKLTECNVDSIYESLSKLICNEGELQYYKKKAIERKEFFELKASVGKWEDILDRL